ncbi:MAG TPA: hypothetical protein VNC50_13000, partial [Planctomycetia bacterium]|nr:hypothetical protein [Planctomycetia bacterium]
FIEGTVLLPNGKPAASCHVGWCMKDSGHPAGPRIASFDDPLASGLMTITDEHGRFKAGPFLPGTRYRLTGLMQNPRREGTAAAEPGAKEVEIRLGQ